jgi:NADPH:quinone reductase-like Zn-dependent oxidoreductase
MSIPATMRALYQTALNGPQDLRTEVLRLTDGAGADLVLESVGGAI